VNSSDFKIAAVLGRNFGAPHRKIAKKGGKVEQTALVKR